MIKADLDKSIMVKLNNKGKGTSEKLLSEMKRNLIVLQMRNGKNKAERSSMRKPGTEGEKSSDKPQHNVDLRCCSVNFQSGWVTFGKIHVDILRSSCLPYLHFNSDLLIVFSGDKPESKMDLSVHRLRA